MAGFARPYCVARHVFLPLGLLLLLTISACGFHLRGQFRLPDGIEKIAVASIDDLSPLRIALERKLQASQRLDKSAADKIEIASDELIRETLSVNDRARVSEYILRYRVTFRLLRKDASTEMPAALIDAEVSREYSFDETQALGAAQEEAIITEELHREMADLILLRLPR